GAGGGLVPDVDAFAFDDVIQAGDAGNGFERLLDGDVGQDDVDRARLGRDALEGPGLDLEGDAAGLLQLDQDLGDVDVVEAHVDGLAELVVADLRLARQLDDAAAAGVPRRRGLARTRFQ